MIFSQVKWTGKPPTHAFTARHGRLLAVIQLLPLTKVILACSLINQARLSKSFLLHDNDRLNSISCILIGFYSSQLDLSSFNYSAHLKRGDPLISSSRMSGLPRLSTAEQVFHPRLFVVTLPLIRVLSPPLSLAVTKL